MTEQKKCALALDKLVFDKIEFKRKGLHSEHEFEAELEAKVGKSEKLKCYLVNLVLRGKKEDEYEIEIELSGYFSFTDDSATEEMKNSLLSQNAVAILLPYLRSELSLLTAQPEMECIVLPPMNVSRS